MTLLYHYSSLFLSILVNFLLIYRHFLHLSKYCQYLSFSAGFKQFQAVLVDFMLIFVQSGEILGEVVETFRDLSSQTPVGRRAKRENDKNWHFMAS